MVEVLTRIRFKTPHLCVTVLVLGAGNGVSKGWYSGRSQVLIPTDDGLASMKHEPGNHRMGDFYSY
jgi:hypothetical protein